MAYETGSASSLSDLLSKINTFATANGYTSDEFDTVNGDWALSKGGVFVSARWDVSSPQYLSIHQATAFDGTGTLPGDHTGDSGNGYNITSSHTNANLGVYRSVDFIGDGPYPSYHFFENDSGPAYFHIVVEILTDRFVHFGFGEIDKIGDWTGGEYAYGCDTDTTAVDTSTGSTIGLDGALGNGSSNERLGATMRQQDLPGTVAAQRWAQVWGQTSQAPDDSSGEEKINLQGGLRAGPIARGFGVFPGSNTSGLIPMYPIVIWNRDIDNNKANALGIQADVRGVNIRNFSPKEEVVIGSDTWVFFPLAIRTLDVINGSSGFSGIAYKKVTA